MELAWWARPGISPENEARFNAALGALVFLFIIGWTYAVYRSVAFDEAPPSISNVTATPLSADAPPAAAYVLDAAVNAGLSHAVLDLSTLKSVPLAQKVNGRIGKYVVGSWPYEKGGKPRSSQYTPPSGLIEVTQQNLDTQISAHLRLRDFVTKGQTNVWPKYVAMSPRVLDKVELTIKELQSTGTPVEHLGVISAFRTPSYNATGGDPTGRAGLSRHMYGDAMDIYIDNNRDGRMDDLNHDGRIDTKDGRIIVNAAKAVEKKYPELLGGIGLYAPTGAHSGFVHVDTRGFRARWGGA